MKKLNFEQMENIQGGASCFFAAPMVVLNAIGMNAFGTYQSVQQVVYCWNS